MQDKHLYEYAVIRIVPKIEREEFINVGLIMFCKRPKFIKARYHVDEEKLRLFTSDIDKESLCTNLHVFDKICSGAKDGGPIASLDIPERFRLLCHKKCLYPNLASTSRFFQRSRTDI